MARKNVLQIFILVVPIRQWIFIPPEQKILSLREKVMTQNSENNYDRDKKDLSPKSAILSSSVASFMSFPLPQKMSSLMMQTYMNFVILNHHSLVLNIAVAWSLALSPVDFVLLPQSAMQAIPKLNVEAEVDMEVLGKAR